jgi:hypothetical protein
MTNSSTLMSRWLYNVEAIRTHFHVQPRSIIPPHTNQAPLIQTIDWWKPGGEDDDSLGNWSRFIIGDFIGQGRRMQYCGLVAAVLESMDSFKIKDRDITSYSKLANNVVGRLEETRPTQWYVTSALSFFMVWSQILMASMISYNTPSVGLGCWTGGHLVYGALSSVSWVVQIARRSRDYTSASRALW